jgi:VWFA-related protein
LGLVVDSSTSMNRYRELLAAAGEAFVRLGNPANDVFVLTFNEEVRSALQAGEAFTSDSGAVAAAVRSMGMRGMTAFHDAVAAAIDWAGRSDSLKKAVVLVSDGGDNASALTFEDVLARAQAANVSFFAIAMSDELDRDAKPDRLRRLARESGGLVFTPRTEKQLHRAFEQIAHDLRSGYTLGFISKAPPAPGEYRMLRVAAGRPNEKTLNVRTRAGYMTAGGGGARGDSR